MTATQDKTPTLTNCSTSNTRLVVDHGISISFLNDVDEEASSRL
jgi:hypothetical protein